MDELFSKAHIQEYIAELSKTLPDKDMSNGVLFQAFCNAKITQDFSRKSLKRVNVTGSQFEKCSFVGVAASGSKFTDTSFDSCDFTGSNFQYCHFENASFLNRSVVQGANFSQSVFIGCTFDGIDIVESTLYDCIFQECTFIGSTIRTDTLENTTICRSILRDINLAHINLEYVRFTDVRMDNIILPPYQIPYIIGGPSYLQHTSDEVYVYTDNGIISADEYAKKYTELTAFFLSQKLYFPLANLLISQGMFDRAFEYICLGIEEASAYLDFRLIKHYCRLACATKEFSNDQLKTLFDHVTDMSYDNTWDVHAIHSYMLNIGEIKEILLNNSERRERVDFIIKTDIDKDDIAAVNDLYNQINLLIQEYSTQNHTDSIELRHNSPYELFVTCIDSLPNILGLISAMYSLFILGSKGLDIAQKIEDVIRAHQQNNLHKHEIEEKKLAVEEKKIDIELKKIELMKAKKSNGISTYSVLELEHTLKCNSIDFSQMTSQECLHYRASNPSKK